MEMGLKEESREQQQGTPPDCTAGLATGEGESCRTTHAIGKSALEIS